MEGSIIGETIIDDGGSSNSWVPTEAGVIDSYSPVDGVQTKVNWVLM